MPNNRKPARPAKKQTARKAKPNYVLSVSDLGHLAGAFYDFENASPARVLASLASLAKWADVRGIIPGAPSMTIAQLINAVGDALPNVLAANGPQLDALAQATDGFKAMGASVKKAMVK